MLKIVDGCYKTSKRRLPIFTRLFPSLIFYISFIGILIRCGWFAKHGRYDDTAWEASSRDILWLLESVGVEVEVEGLEHIENCDGPTVFIGNHMSMMETLVLPAFIVRSKPATFIIKESLLHYPIFKYVMRSRNPIAVTRTNPRADLKTVLTEGNKRLTEGVSIIVFPQTTRQQEFNPKKMSSIGSKLASRSQVSIIPIALKTDAWKVGRLIKDFGRIDPREKSRFAFGPPISADSENKQNAVNEFIAHKLAQW